MKTPFSIKKGFPWLERKNKEKIRKESVFKKKENGLSTNLM